jgi:hypothetical protein
MTYRDKLSAYLTSNWSTVRENFKALEPHIWEPSDDDLTRVELLALAAELLEIEPDALDTLADLPEEIDSGEDSTWSTELGAPIYGNFACELSVRTLELRDGSAGVQVVEASFGDLDAHPDMRTEGAESLVRIYDLEAGWVVTSHIDSGRTVGVAATEFEDREELRMKCHARLRV